VVVVVVRRPLTAAWRYSVSSSRVIPSVIPRARKARARMATRARSRGVVVVVGVVLGVVVVGVVALGALVTTTSAAVVRGDDDDALEGPTDADEALVSWFAQSPLTHGTLAGGAMYTVIQREYDYDGGVKRRGRQRGVFSTSSGDRGVLATLRVSGGLTATRGDWEENGPQRALAEVNDEWALAVMLMRERAKGKASKFAPFVHSLYAHTPASAVVVSAGAREALEAYSAGETIQDADADVKRGWASAKKTFKQFPTIFSNRDFFSRKAFEEALAIVRANAFAVDSPNGDGAPGKTYRALVPMAHLIPHNTQSTVPCVRIENDEFVIEVDPHEAQAEMTCSHGNYSDAEAFARFSSTAYYSEAPNPANIIKLALPKGDFVVKHKDFCGSESRFGITAEGATPELMCVLRLGSANATELRRVTKSPKAVRSLRTKGVSERSELAVYDVIFATLTSLLNDYPTSDAEDKTLLETQQHTMKDDVPQAILIRHNEKKLAVDALNKAQYYGRKHLGHVLFDEHFSGIAGLGGGIGKSRPSAARVEL